MRIKWDNWDEKLGSMLCCYSSHLPGLPPFPFSWPERPLFPYSRFLSPFSSPWRHCGGAGVHGPVWAAHNKDILRRMKKQYPTVFVMVVMLASYFLIYLFRESWSLCFSITFPLLCKWIWALCLKQCAIHSSVRNVPPVSWGGVLAGLQNYQRVFCNSRSRLNSPLMAQNTYWAPLYSSPRTQK